MSKGYIYSKADVGLPTLVKQQEQKIAELEAQVEPLQPFKERILELEATLERVRELLERKQRYVTAVHTRDMFTTTKIQTVRGYNDELQAALEARDEQ